MVHGMGTDYFFYLENLLNGIFHVVMFALEEYTLCHIQRYLLVGGMFTWKKEQWRPLTSHQP